MFITPMTLTLSLVHGVSDHRQRSCPSAAERRSHPRDGAGVERPASQPTSPQSSVHRYDYTTQNPRIVTVAGLTCDRKAQSVP